jgi:hypothetical protein
MILILLSLAAPQPVSLTSDASRIDQLIQQLGSEFYAEREAATKALDRVGVPALGALYKASESSSDAEISRRAQGLLKRIEPRAYRERALSIRNSKLSPEEKAVRLKPMLNEGMICEEVNRLLGQPITVFSIYGGSTSYYEACGLTIEFDKDNRVKLIR